MIIRHCSVCGVDFTVHNRYKNYLLPEFEHLCSTECLANRIKNTKGGITPVAIMMPTNLQPPSEYYSNTFARFFRSKFEGDFAVWLSTKGIDWEYESQTLNIHGREYTPDFTIPGTNLHIELKGVWSGGAKAKTIATVRAGVNLLLIPYYFSKLFLQDIKGV